MSRMRVVSVIAASLATACSTPTMPEADHDHLLGTWEGEVSTPVGKFPVTFHISEDDLGLKCILDSPNQNRRSVYCDGILVSAEAVQILVPAVDARYTGWFEDERLRGHWTQAGLNFHLELSRTIPPEPELVLGPEDSE